MDWMWTGVTSYTMVVFAMLAVGWLAELGYDMWTNRDRGDDE
jgi:hypothetical protein